MSCVYNGVQTVEDLYCLADQLNAC